MILEQDGGKVKPAHYQQEYTPEQIHELYRCSVDPVYFIHNYVKTQHPVKGPVPLELYDYQDLMVENYLNYDRVISMCSRQVGKTTTAVAFILWWVCFKSDQFVIMAANKGKTANEIMRRFWYMYEELPWFIKPGVVQNNVFTKEFDNKSLVLAETTTVNTGRGYAVSLLYLDEFAKVQPNIQDDFWMSIMPTLSTGGRCIITSTPDTDEDKFASLWFAAKDVENSKFFWKDKILEENGIEPNAKRADAYETVYEDPVMALDAIEPLKRGEASEEFGFRRFFVHWSAHPDRDERYKRKVLAEGTSMEMWIREYECQFIGESATLIDQSRLSLLSYTTRKPVLVDKRGVRWYQPIRPNLAHAIVLDPSEGVLGDNSVIQVWSLPDLKQVAEWASNSSDQIEQARMLLRIMKKIYAEQQADPDHAGDSNIYYSIEKNGNGVGVINLILYEGEEKFPGDFIDSDGNKGRGIVTSERMKRDYCFQLKKMIERGIFQPASADLVTELKMFIQTGKSFAGKTGWKDDRVMSCVLMLALLDEIKYTEDGIEEALHVPLASSSRDGSADEYDEDDFEEPLMPLF